MLGMEEDEASGFQNVAQSLRAENRLFDITLKTGIEIQFLS